MTFKRIPGKLPSPSCVHISLEDAALQDVSSVLYANKVIDVSNVTIGSEYDFELVSKRPKYLHGSYSVSATINVGWCANADSKSWIRQKDYLTDSQHNVALNENNPDYNIELWMKYYCMSISICFVDS